MQTNEEFTKERRKLLAEGKAELAQIRKLARNRLVMSPYKDRPRIFIGNDEYFSQEGAVNDGGRSWVLVPPRSADE